MPTAQAKASADKCCRSTESHLLQHYMFELARGLQTKGSRDEVTGIARSVRETTGFNEIAQLFEMQERSVHLSSLHSYWNQFASGFSAWLQRRSARWAFLIRLNWLFERSFDWPLNSRHRQIAPVQTSDLSGKHRLKNTLWILWTDPLLENKASCLYFANIEHLNTAKLIQCLQQCWAEEKRAHQPAQICHFTAADQQNTPQGTKVPHKGGRKPAKTFWATHRWEESYTTSKNFWFTIHCEEWAELSGIF